jgi:hypothetical protein
MLGRATNSVWPAGFGAITRPHKAVRGSFKQKSKGYLSESNTGVPSHWLTCHDYSTCIAHHRHRLGAWTLAILKVKRRLEDAAAIHRRLARGQDLSRF